MKKEVTRKFALSRSELQDVVRHALGIPTEVTLDSFTMESAALADPQPVLWLSYTQSEEDEVFT